MTEAMDIPDDVIEKVSDYLDGALTGDAKADVEKKLAEDALWQRAHEELKSTRDFMSGMQKARAPVSFASDVTATIRKRSAGKFFGPRVPNALLVVALLAIVVVAWLMWTSSSGMKPDSRTQDGRPGSGELAPKP